MEFNNFLYAQVLITLDYFLFGLGFIQIFLHNILLVSDIWYLIFVYVILNILAFPFSIIEILSYISIQCFIPLHLFQVLSLHLAIDQSYTSQSLYAQLH